VCHTPRECVDWNWIASNIYSNCRRSHSARVCGLKHRTANDYLLHDYVTLRASVWIETRILRSSVTNQAGHTPRECVDWNENNVQQILSSSASHSARVCGLKRYYKHLIPMITRHTPRECVDWNYFVHQFNTGVICVTLRASVWIETIIRL